VFKASSGIQGGSNINNNGFDEDLEYDEEDENDCNHANNGKRGVLSPKNKLGK
jgi:hypothetical protein